MINNSFDDHIKKSFGEYEPKVPDHIWENIVAGKEKRRPAGVLFDLAGNRITFIILVLILSAGGAVLVHSFNNKTPGKNELVAKGSIPGNTTIQDNNNIINTDPSISNQQKVDNKNNPGQTNTTDQNINSKADNTTIAATPKSTMTGAGHKDDKANGEGLEQPAAKKSQSSNYYSNDVPATTGLPSRKKEKRSPAKFSITTENSGFETDSKEITTAAVSNNEVSLDKYYLDLHTPLPGTPFPSTVKNHNLPDLNIPCPAGEKNAAANKRYFEIYGGPDYVFSTFADTANSTYLQKRKESTSFTSAFSVGFRYTKVFNNAMSFRTGLNYSQVNEKFKYEQGHIIQLVYDIDANGDTTGSYATTGTRYKTTHNRYKTLDIPLMIGYEMGNGRLHTNINAGLVVNVYSWQKGDVLDNTYQPVNITTGKSSSPYQFKTNIGVGFMGAVSFYYKLNDRLHILGEPYFRYNLSSANKSEITLKQKYTTTGLRLGLRIDF